MPRVLIADDEPNIREVISFALERAGYSTATARNGSEAIQQFRRGPLDLIILDIGMPEMDGLEVCRQIRKTSEVPILFLSARDEEIDRVLGLEIGGDDYVTKPFSPRELVARVNVILRRARPAPVEEEADDREFAHGKLMLVPASHAASFDGRPRTLTASEFAILKGFLARPQHVLGRDAVMANAYASNIHVSERTVDSHIRNVRAKLAAVGCADAIATVHGVGFRLGRC